MGRCMKEVENYCSTPKAFGGQKQLFFFHKNTKPHAVPNKQR